MARKRLDNLKEKIKKLRAKGLTRKVIKDMVGLKSEQAVKYHEEQ